MFGVNGLEFLALTTLMLLVIGPQRLPDYATHLARFVRQTRTLATTARKQVQAEVGPEFEDVDWQALDLRQYDPRRIVREALSGDTQASSGVGTAPPAETKTSKSGVTGSSDLSVVEG